MRNKIAFFFLVITACILGSIQTSNAQSQTYPASGQFIVPNGMTTVQVEAWGGGGGGGGADGALFAGTRSGGGGAGGSYTKANSVSVSSAANITVTVGTGGAGNATSNGNTGLTSTFASGTPVNAAGGLGGAVGNASDDTGSGAAATTGLTFGGGAGSTAVANNSGAGGGGAGNGGAGAGAVAAVGGAGGSGTISGGIGGAGRTSNGDGNDGAGLSAGGGGARTSGITDRNGGDGIKGQIIVTYTCPTYALTSAASATGPFCGASTSVVTLRSSSMVSGTYTVTYNLSGAITANASTASMTFASGTGSGTFTTPSLPAGITNIMVIAITSSYCTSSIAVNNTASVTVSAPPTAVSGTAVTTCAGNGAVSITAGSSSSNNSGISWTTNNGSGTFSNANSITLATYTPSAADIAAGSVTIILNANGNAPCTNASSNKTLTINQAPTASAGGTSIICTNQTATVNGASSSNGTIAWTENGAGTITSGANTLTPTYTPAAGDAGNTVTLTMTVSNAGCTSAIATYTVSVVGAPTAAAGSAFTTCSVNGPVNITTGSSATNNSGILWSTNGTGVLTNANSLTLATYDPSTADIAAGSVTFLLTATGNGPCANATSTKTLSISKQPTASAGGSQTICQNGTATVSGATSSNGTIAWTENGAGTITSGANTLTPTYTAAAGDANNNVILTMTISNSPCIAATAVYTIHVNGSATATAGTAITACANEASVNITAGAAVSNAASVNWTTSGNGTFTNATSLTAATYTPSAADIAAGSVFLTLTAIGNAPCVNATASKTFNIRPVPVTTNVSICPGGSGSLTSSTVCTSAAPTSSGAKLPASGVTTGTGTAWTSPGSIFTDNNAFATVSSVSSNFTTVNVTSQALFASNFGFSIPANATIVGITATIGRYKSSSATLASTLTDNTVVLVKAGTAAGNNKASATAWTTSEAAIAYGSGTDLWGTTWTPSQINASNFGVALAVNVAANLGTTTASVDYMQLNVAYTVPGSLNWYTAASGGTLLGTGLSFNPVGIDPALPNTNTPGTYTYYAECATVAGCRTPATFTINPLPDVSFTGLAAVYCENDASISLSANHSGGSFSGAGITNTGAGTASFNPVTAGLGPHVITYSYTNENTCSNTINQTVNVNSNVIYYADADGDTYGNIAVTSVSCIGAPTGYVTNNTDCNDADATKHQAYPFYADADNDSYGAGSLLSVCAVNGSTPPFGYSLNGTDCNDANASVYQSATLYIDVDSDGYDNGTQVMCYGASVPAGYALTSNGSDCNDADATKHQAYPFYADADNDSYGAGSLLSVCAVNGSTPPFGYSLNGTDCNDANALVYQSATLYIDADSDGYDNGTQVMCYGASVPTGYALTSNGSDCNDADATKHQAYPFYADADNDSYGAGSLLSVCAVNGSTPPFGYSLNGTDCNDANALVYQSATLYIDVDGDGYDNGTQVMCYGASVPTGYALTSNGSDCNDADATKHQAYSFYADADNDSYGAGSLLSVCAVNGSTPPFGYSLNGTDCNDANASVYQSALLFVDADADGYDNGTQTVCYGANIPTGFATASNGNDCNDNDNTKHNQYPFYTDADGDSFGAGNQVAACAVDAVTPPSGYSLGNTDCDDANANIYQTGTFFVDTDNDGYTSGATASVCYGAATPSGYAVSNIGIDCNDNVFAINPAHAEVFFNGVDDNCNGQLDEGSQIRTKVLPSNCGTTLASIGSLIGITTVSSAITGYRIKLVNGSNVQIIEKSVPHFTLNEFPMHEYATTYTVSIELQRLGVWLGYYGDSCFVSSPAVLAEGGAASVSPSQCGMTLSRINTLIATTSLPGVTSYRFQVTNLTNPIGPNVVQVITRTQNWFSLQMLAQYNYGTAYRIEVAVKTTGTFGGYGSPCEISSPASPSLEVCGGTVTASTSRVAASSLNGVTQYRFQIQRDIDGATTTIDRNTNYFTFAMIPGYSPNAVYNVRVAVMTTGTWSPLGDACQITSPASVSRNTVQPEAEVKSELPFSIVAYPNPFASDFRLNMTTASYDDIQIMVYDMSGRMIEELQSSAKDFAAQQMGAQYPAGVYNVVVTQGDNVKTLRVVKR